jgi:ribonuclease P protein component
MDNNKRIKGEWFDLVLKTQIGPKKTPKIVVSLKVSKKATERNRIKRLIRVAVSKINQVFESEDLMVIVKKNFSKEKSQVVEQKLKNQLGSLI